MYEPLTAEELRSLYEGNRWAYYAPNNEVDVMDLPAIYAFSGMRGGGDGIAYAMAADGTVLGSHWCSHEGYVLGDLGVHAGTRADRHKTFLEHYPNGYRMEFVRASDINGHAALQEAFRLNKLSAPPEEQETVDAS